MAQSKRRTGASVRDGWSGDVRARAPTAAVGSAALGNSGHSYTTEVERDVAASCCTTVRSTPGRGCGMRYRAVGRSSSPPAVRTGRSSAWIETAPPLRVPSVHERSYLCRTSNSWPAIFGTCRWMRRLTWCFRSCQLITWRPPETGHGCSVHFAAWLRPGGLLLMLAPRSAQNPFAPALAHPTWHNVFSSAELADLCECSGFTVEILCGRIGRLAILAKQLAWETGQRTGMRVLAYPLQWMMTVLDSCAESRHERATLMWLLMARAEGRVVS